jgi:phenylacetate-CoA ligase
MPLEPIEHASTDALRALQLERLRKQLVLAWEKVPHYRAKFDAAGVHPGDLRTLEDLSRFPFTTKEDLRSNYPFGMFAVPREQVVRIHAASGARAGDIVHVSYGYGLFTGGLGAHYGAEKLGLTVVPFGGGQTERQVQLIRDFGASIIMVTPSYMLAIADEFERQGLDPASSSLRIGIFGAEPWTNEMRMEIERRMGIDAVDIYGLSEVMGPGVANECIETKDGPTIWEDHFFPEIIDPDTGAPLPDGEFGELVFTSLTKEALPIIRYRTRDLTRLLPGTARTMRRMQKITGRSDDMMIVRGVNVFPSQIEELILQRPELAPHYVCELGKDGPLDTLTVRVESKPGLAHDGAAAVQSARALQHAIKTFIGVSADIRVEPTSAIERSVGKARRVIDKRPKPGAVS